MSAPETCRCGGGENCMEREIRPITKTEEQALKALLRWRSAGAAFATVMTPAARQTFKDRERELAEAADDLERERR